uniref:uncharacterized protein LOC113475777 n=1 Tax=Ciona intestinalis TaxID=7719 RepID=UPI000EF459DA|nr:uncharacterized protein LOC113475777 [Ciona intestinalis]|eukprot:XP_026696340.1 uncharacterized protein LOC113475777 [Ciona intestinalis]
MFDRDRQDDVEINNVPINEDVQATETAGKGENEENRYSVRKISTTGRPWWLTLVFAAVLAAAGIPLCVMGGAGGVSRNNVEPKFATGLCLLLVAFGMLGVGGVMWLFGLRRTGETKHDEEAISENTDVQEVNEVSNPWQNRRQTRQQSAPSIFINAVHDLPGNNKQRKAAQRSASAVGMIGKAALSASKGDYAKTASNLLGAAKSLSASGKQDQKRISDVDTISSFVDEISTAGSVGTSNGDQHDHGRGYGPEPGRAISNKTLIGHLKTSATNLVNGDYANSAASLLNAAKEMPSSSIVSNLVSDKNQSISLVSGLASSFNSEATEEKDTSVPEKVEGENNLNSENIFLGGTILQSLAVKTGLANESHCEVLRNLALPTNRAESEELFPYKTTGRSGRRKPLDKFEDASISKPETASTMSSFNPTSGTRKKRQTSVADLEEALNGLDYWATELDKTPARRSVKRSHSTFAGTSLKDYKPKWSRHRGTVSLARHNSTLPTVFRSQATED